MNEALSPEQNMTLERLRSLYELIGRMNSVYELEELLAFVVDQALSLTGGERGLLLLSEGHRPKPQHVAVARGKALDAERLDRVLEFVSTTVIKDVLDRGEPRLVVDLHTDQRYEDFTNTDTFKVKQVRSVLAVPLKIATQLVGLIYIDHPTQAAFGQDELDFLSAFANQSALAINRARQHRRQLEELALLNELSRSVVRVLDLDKVLTHIVYEAIRMLDVKTGSVLLLDEERDELAFATSISYKQRVNIPARLPREQGIAGWVLTNGKPAIVTDVTQDERWFGEVEPGFVTHSLLCVPLSLDERVLGVIQVLNKEGPRGFDEEDLARLSAFASWATIAIENARLFQEASQARRLSALNEIALTLSSTLDLDTVLNTGLEEAMQLLQVEAGAINLVNNRPQLDLPSTQFSRGLASDRQRQALAELAALARPADEVLVVDREHPAGQEQALALLDSGFEALALVPLQAGSEAEGVLVVMRPVPHTFSQEELDLLISLARIIGLATQNAAHHTQMRTQARHLTYLNQVGAALISSLDLAHVLKVIIEGVNTLLETERTSVFLIDPQTNELVLRYSNEGDADIRLPAPWQGIAGWVATHDQPALVNDTLSDPRHLRQIAVETGYEAQSILCAPLKVEGEVIGVIEVLNKTGGEQFTHHHQNLLTQFTWWAAIAIHNARLFDERVQAFQRLAAEQERRIAAEARGAMAAVILDMAHTMNNIVGAIRVWASSLEQAALSRPQAGLSGFKREIGHIRQNAEEAIKLIGNMTGPLERPELAPTDLHQCLAAAIKSCWWPDNVSLSRQYGPDVPPVKANAQRLEAVFHNLLSNAIQAMAGTGGEIRLSTAYDAAADRVEVAIADNGPGIPPDLQNHMFNPGVSGTAEGLGIGLWLVETFIHQFEGHIGFTSVEGEGTTFVVTLSPMPSETKA